MPEAALSSTRPIINTTSDRTAEKFSPAALPFSAYAWARRGRVCAGPCKTGRASSVRRAKWRVKLLVRQARSPRQFAGARLATRTAPNPVYTNSIRAGRLNEIRVPIKKTNAASANKLRAAQVPRRAASLSITLRTKLVCPGIFSTDYPRSALFSPTVRTSGRRGGIAGVKSS